MTNDISTLYNHVKTLVKQWTYTKNEIDTSLNGKANSSHTHDSDELIDDTAYANLGTSANSTQSQINSAINTRIGNVIQFLVGTQE